jgi:hypothetical protein
MSHAGINGMRAAGDDLVNVADKLTDEPHLAGTGSFRPAPESSPRSDRSRSPRSA